MLQSNRRWIWLGVVLFLSCLVSYLWAQSSKKVVEPLRILPSGHILSSTPQELKKYVQGVIRTQVARNAYNLSGLAESAAFIQKTWTQMGLKVRKQSFKASGDIYSNLLTSVGPTKGPRIVLGAHYDVCGDQQGADDNASGVAGLLALSKLLKANEKKLKYRVDLVAYTLEEPPFFGTNKMGSAIHARSLKKAGTSVKWMASLEMIGYFSDKKDSQSFPTSRLRNAYPSKGNFIIVVGDTSSTGYRLTRHFKGWMNAGGAVPAFSLNAPSRLRGVGFSDHRNFWKVGYPAVMITDTAFYRNPNYHKPTDTIDTLDFKRMNEVVKGLYWAVVQTK